jgi:hypothetical protein
MANRKDYTGIRYYRLVALKHHYGEYWLVRCDCGKEKVIRFNGRGGAKSCGCLHIEQCTLRPNSVIHGDAREGKVKRLHNIWRNMIQKCYHEKCDRYKYYGARGIKICDEWRYNYIPFRDWAISNGYDEKLTINRIDNDGNYELSNCNWVGMKEQTRNTRRTHWVILNGEKMSLAECAEINNIPYRKLEKRLRVDGLNIEDAVK